MKIRNILGLALLGGAAYAHKQHGGDFTLESIKQSLRDLLTAIQQQGKPIAAQASEKLREAVRKREPVPPSAPS